MEDFIGSGTLNPTLSKVCNAKRDLPRRKRDTILGGKTRESLRGPQPVLDRPYTQRITLGDVFIDRVDMTDALELFSGFFVAGRTRHVITLNVDYFSTFCETHLFAAF